MNKFCSPTSSDDLCLLFCINPSSMTNQQKKTCYDSLLPLFLPGLLLPGGLVASCLTADRSADSAIPPLLLLLCRLVALPLYPFLHVAVRVAALFCHDSCKQQLSRSHENSCKWQLISVRTSSAEIYFRKIQDISTLYICITILGVIFF